MAESFQPEGEWRLRDRHEISSNMKDQSRKSADLSNNAHEGEFCSSFSQFIESENSEAMRRHGSKFKTTAQKQSKPHGQKRKYDLRPQRQKAIIEVSDGEEDLVFTDCEKTTLGKDVLRQHKSCKTRVICIHCQRPSSTRRILFTHLISQHGEDAENAEKLVRAAEVFKFLTTENQDGRPLVCNLCSRSYRNPVRLQEHITSHTSGTSKCPVCNKVYSKRRDLQRHVQKHRRRTRFMCPDCPYNCLTDRLFWQHMIVAHKLSVQEAKSLAKIKQNEGPDLTNDSEQVLLRTEENSTTKVKERPSKPVRIRKSKVKIQATKPIRAPKDRVAVDIGQSFTGMEDGSSVTFVLDHSTVPGVSDSFQLDDIEDQRQNNSQIPLGGPEMEYLCLSCNRTFHSARSLRRHICTIINKLNVKTASNEDMECQSADSCALGSKVLTQARSRNSPTKQIQTLEKGHGNRPAVCMDKNDTGGRAPDNSGCGNSEPFTALKRFNCKICLKKFPRSTSLAVHIIRAHDGKITRFLCTLCGRKFWKSDQLQMHVLKIHHVAPEVAANFTSMYPKVTPKRAVGRHSSRPLAAVRGSVECVESVKTATNMEQPKKKRSVSSHCCNRSELAVSEQFSGHCVYQTTRNSMESDLVACITHFTQAVQKIPVLISGSLRGMQNVVPPSSGTSSMRPSSDTCQCGQVEQGLKP